MSVEQTDFAMEEEQDLFVVYDIQQDRYTFSEKISEIFSNNFNVLDIKSVLINEVFISQDDYEDFVNNFKQARASDKISVSFKKCLLKTKGLQPKLFGCGFICADPGKRVIVTLKDMSVDDEKMQHLERMAEYDDLTGLYNSTTFCRKINNLFIEKGSEIKGKYAIIYFDVIKFKAINDLFGKAGGDLILLYIGEVLKDLILEGEMACRVGSDRFAIFVRTEGKDLSKYAEQLIDLIGEYELTMKVSCNVGIYVIEDTQIASANMLDRAILAEAAIKGTFAQQYKFYTEELRKQMLDEQEIVGSMVKALHNGEFVPYFQPQFNHSTGELVGAEALVRWIHPEKGLVAPSTFIPIFESNGFITPLDMFIFDRTCAFIRERLDSGKTIVPISTNFSRYDIYQNDFVEKLESIREKYRVPVKYIRVEITESAVFGGNEYTNGIVHRLHQCGYIVEMDDFGSGYSSLNVLKDIDFDIIKLDMKFFAGENSRNRGGTVILSVINMAKWLNLSVIAEGVETVEQADFLKSLGSDYIQGYLYSRPISEEDFSDLLDNKKTGYLKPKVQFSDSINSIDFWNPKSMDTLIFSKFVGPACIFRYSGGKIEILRMNEKYIKEIGMGYSEKEMFNFNAEAVTNTEDLKIYDDMLARAVKSGAEEECETWRNFRSKDDVEHRICIRSTVHLIGKSDTALLFYCIIRNMTNNKDGSEGVQEI